MELNLEEVELAEVVGYLVRHPLAQRVYVKFSNPDINYLQRKTGLDHRVVARTIRIFGEAVVLESLRRTRGRCEPGVFVGICRRVEAAGGDPYGARPPGNGGTAPLPRSPLGETDGS